MAPSSTRHSILDILKREGPQEAAALARRLGITPMAVGLQLSALEEEKLVSSRPEQGKPPKRGRPVQVWSLTDAAIRIFPDAHALLTVGLLSSLQEVYGQQGFQKLLDVRTRQQLEEYRLAVPAEAPLKDKVKALAEVRDKEGYMTEVGPAPGGGFFLIENHCPICMAAKSCQGFCESEMQVFKGLLGPDVGVSREEHLLSGSRRCAYLISPSPSPSPVKGEK